jgi:mycothiol synthase
MTSTALEEIHVPERPAIVGLRFRHYRGPADHAGMARVNQAVRDDMGALDVVTEESIARQYAALVNSDLHDDLLIVELDGEIAGYARVEWRDAIDGPRYLQTVCLLDPPLRRRGIGSAMLAWQERRLVEIAASFQDERPTLMRSWSFDRDAGAGALLEKRGWHRQGHGYEMVRPTIDAIPEVTLPDGFELRPATVADARRIWEAAAEAFRDERGEGEWSEGDWERESADPHRDPSLWAIAWAGDEIAAGVHGRIDPDENAHLGVAQGYIAGVWTRRPYRRRGLARALLADVLARLRDRRMTRAHLGVDGLNPNRAMDLYTSLGFEVHTAETDWSKPVPGPADDGDAPQPIDPETT